MSGIWNRTLVYLGLREEPEEMYDDLPERFVPEDDPHAEHAPERPSSRSSAGAAAQRPAKDASSRTSRIPAMAGGAVGGVPPGVIAGEATNGAGRSAPRAAGEDRPGDGEGRPRDGRGRSRGRDERPRTVTDRAEVEAEDNVRSLRSGSDVFVRAVPSSPVARAAVIDIEVFDDVEAVGARYRTGQPVLFDVSGTDRATGRRVVDFVSGLTFALRGRLTKVGTGAFLLVPDGIELPADERRRLDDLGYRLPAGSDG